MSGTPGTATRSTEYFRRVLLALALASGVGAAVELTMLRHWTSATQLIPWPAIAGVILAVGLLAGRPAGRRTAIARALAIAVAAVALVGVAEHVVGNYRAGPLDYRYTARWATMSVTSRVWAAATQSVGPSPILAPLVLLQAAASVWFATLAGAAAPRPAD